MGVIAQNDRQLNFYYSDDSSIAKQTLGFLEASGKEIQMININETKLTGTQWAELSKGLHTTIDGLINKEHPSAADIIGDADFDEHDWIDVLNNCPQVFEYPIAMNGNKFMQIQTPSDILKFYDVDSAGLEKHNVGDNPDISTNTKDDDFVK